MRQQFSKLLKLDFNLAYLGTRLSLFEPPIYNHYTQRILNFFYPNFSSNNLVTTFTRLQYPAVS
jgi:hypothetical protein